MEDIDIPEANKETKSTRIDTIAHDILRKLSVVKYGSESHMSAVLTDAVRFVHDPTPTQRVAQEKFLNNIEVYPRDPDCSQSKVIHWTAPSELVKIMNSLSANNRDFIESAIYEYESAYDTMSDEFSVESINQEQVVDWDVMEDNYSQSMNFDEIEGANVPSKPAKRRPFLLSLIIEFGVGGFDVFLSNYYEKVEEEYGVSGLPSTRKTRKNDWDYLVDHKHLIPSPEEKSERPIESVESDNDGYYLRRNIGEPENKLEDIIEDYLQDTQEWIENRSESGTTYETTDPPFRRRENTMSVISGYDIREFEEYAERADELQNKMVKELVEIPN
jgi:hypothetical protein